MEFLVASFFAGALTILAPCVLALLPVILGGSIGEKNPLRPLVIALSLGVSVFVFTIILKATTILIGIPQEVWQWISGGLILFFGISMILPSFWEKIACKLKLYKSETLLSKNAGTGGLKGAILLGASLGPVFSTCSPTYALILGIVLPQSFTTGVINIAVYSIGLMIPLVAIGYGGRSVAAKFRFAANPNGWFKKGLGTLLVITGAFIFTGFDKKIEIYILQSGYFGPIEIEQSLLEKIQG